MCRDVVARNALLKRSGATVLEVRASQKEEVMMHYNIIESQHYPGTWQAEAIDDMGRVFVVAFSGPEAEKRAREYANWKNVFVHETVMPQGSQLYP
jgi:hypothetical protein